MVYFTYLECLDEDEDVLSALGSGLAKIVPFLGAAQRAHHIIPILEHLAAIEDISVRNRVKYSSFLYIKNVKLIF